MSNETTTQLGLTFVFLAVAGLMALLQRVERSASIRIWMAAFILFATDSALSAVRSILDLPDFVRVVSWCALAGGALTGSLGTLKFLGRSLPKKIYFLAGGIAAFAIGGALFQMDINFLRPFVFIIAAIAFAWGGVAAFQAGVPGGAGKWVASSAFFAASVYAGIWPLVYAKPIMAQLEFFLDLVVLLWSANGVLLMHFDRSRQRVREFAAKEMALKEKLAQAERLEALSRLAAGVAHDFNNVLTIVINGSNQVLRQIEDRPQAVRHLKMVRQAAEGAVGFTKQLLALGRRRLPGRKPTRLCEAVESALKMIRPSLLHQTTVLHVNSPEQDSAVNAADGQIEQLLVNLALNAKDAMPDGGALTIGWNLKPEDDSLVRLTVEDTGAGMDETTRSRIFDPFFTTKDSNGTGLGLAAVYAIVQQLDGDITVNSEQGKGTVFTIDLPTCPLPKEERPSRAMMFDPKGIRVLVVDDHEAVMRTLTDGLCAVGFDAEGLCDPVEAMKAARKNPPDVLLTDVCMPSMNGTTLAEDVQAVGPNVRVILMSGIAQEEVGDSPSEGVVRMMKPVTVESLTNTIQSLTVR
jgi:signal transduction histidine kinase/CheY-like chemotaxis protein